MCLIISSLSLMACDQPNRKLWPPKASESIGIYVSTDGFHSSIILPQNKADLPFVGYAFVEKAWYLRESQGCFPAVRAMLLPSTGVIEEIQMATAPKRTSINQVWAFKVSPKSLNIIRQEINKLIIDKSEIRAYQRRNIKYYRSTSYHLFNTCNSFTADILESAGLPIHSYFVISSDEIIERLDNIKAWHLREKVK